VPDGHAKEGVQEPPAGQLAMAHEVYVAGSRVEKPVIMTGLAPTLVTSRNIPPAWHGGVRQAG